MSARLARIKWNRRLLYPRGDEQRLEFAWRHRSSCCRGGWKFCDPLAVLRDRRDDIEFQEVFADGLVDSPLNRWREFSQSSPRFSSAVT